jgi:predicted metal-binding protein
MEREEQAKIGIIICDRYHRCAGGKCFRALREREGAFSRYRGREAVLVGCATCDGCPGGNVEYAPEEMVRNGANVIHLATGLIVGYPPCPRIGFFRDFIQSRFSVEVVFGTHPIPRKYYLMHQGLHTWDSPFWQEAIRDVLTDDPVRGAYD